MGAGDPPPFLCLLRRSHASVGTADVAAMHTSSMGRPCHPGEWVAAIPNTRDCPSRLASRPSRQRPTEPPRYMGGAFTDRYYLCGYGRGRVAPLPRVQLSAEVDQQRQQKMTKPAQIHCDLLDGDPHRSPFQ